MIHAAGSFGAALGTLEDVVLSIEFGVSLDARPAKCVKALQ